MSHFWAKFYKKSIDFNILCRVLVWLILSLLPLEPIFAAAPITGEFAISRRASKSWSQCAQSLKSLHLASRPSLSFMEAYGSFYALLEEDVARALAPQDFKMHLSKGVRYGGGRFERLEYEVFGEKVLEVYFKKLGSAQDKLRFDITVSPSMRKMGLYDLALSQILSLNTSVQNFPALLFGVNKSLFFNGIESKIDDAVLRGLSIDEVKQLRQEILSSLEATPIFKLRQKHGFTRVEFVRIDLFRKEAYVSFSTTKSLSFAPTRVAILGHDYRSLGAKELTIDRGVSRVSFEEFVDSDYEHSLQAFERFPLD